METIRDYVIPLFAFLLLPMLSLAETGTSMISIHTNDDLASVLKQIEQQHTNIVHLHDIAQSTEGNPVWLLELGQGDEATRSTNPAVLYVGGIEGTHLAGTEVLLAFVDIFLNNEESRDQLSHTTLYVLPRLNPDATAFYWQSPKQNRLTNTIPADDDNDGWIDEDGVDDLNDDQIISMVRVQDPKGEWIAHPDDERVLIKADPLKSESGQWLYFEEGFDNDGDERINEDGLGGVNLNQNFPFQYPWFEQNAGIHSISTPETRGLAEFIVEHPNIALVFSYSNHDNLLNDPESGKPSERRQPQEIIVEDDAAFYEHLGEQYREHLGFEKPIKLNDTTSSGTFPEWIYFHRGRLSLSTPVWSPEIALAFAKLKQAESSDKEGDTEGGDSEETEQSQNIEDSESESNNNLADEESAEKEKEEDTKQAEETRGKTELDYLEWVEEHAPSYFLPWQSIEHPDYPGQTAEVGGWAPYSQTVPPAEVYDTMRTAHLAFLNELPGILPRVNIASVKQKHLGAGVYELTVQISNTGFLPTALSHGERSRQVIPTRLEIDLPPEAFLSGQAMQRLPVLSGSGGHTEVRYIIKPDRETIDLNLISAIAGNAQATITMSQGGEE